MGTHEMSRPIAGSGIGVGAVAFEAAAVEAAAAVVEAEPVEVAEIEPVEAAVVFVGHSGSCRSLFS